MSDNSATVDTERVDEHLKEIDKMFETQTIWQRLSILFTGLGKPRSSKEYKEAVIEAQRLSAPAAAIILPILFVVVLIVMSAGTAGEDRVIETQVMEAETIKELEKPEEIKPPEEQVDVDIDIPIDTPNVNVDTTEPISNQPMSPQPAPIDAALTIKSPVVLKNIYGVSRNAGMRGTSLRNYGGDKYTENAVMAALRWLKKTQNKDGSWNGQNKIAMTGLGILTFLAHGEKPGADSPEFGPTVQRALEYLLANQLKENSGGLPKGTFKGMDGNWYALPIAAYALCEAFGMTGNPNVKDAAEAALGPIIRGQHPTGGWTYKCNPAPDSSYAKYGGYRDDTSYMGWCAQALKAAKLSHLKVEGLPKAIKLAIKGFKKNAHKEGGFGYCGPGRGGLTSVGTLCMMLLGASNDKDVKNALNLMESWKPFFASRAELDALAKTPEFAKKGKEAVNAATSRLVSMKLPKVSLGGSTQYYFYYATQCKFHQGGKQWTNWNTAMKPPYVKAQIIEKDAIEDMKGKKCDIGHWRNADHYSSATMDTCLAALQLMVYYRYLPTTKQDAVKVEEEITASATDTDDITVDSVL
ncbi:MAG: terpene cyclase/mutase family protein [Kiritimatiellae bacterium]|nr:terpene cyclase/mutase family protein [Kiritimatiellia bacterium]